MILVRLSLRIVTVFRFEIVVVQFNNEIFCKCLRGVKLNLFLLILNQFQLIQLLLLSFIFFLLILQFSLQIFSFGLFIALHLRQLYFILLFLFHHLFFQLILFQMMVCLNLDLIELLLNFRSHTNSNLSVLFFFNLAHFYTHVGELFFWGRGHGNSNVGKVFLVGFRFREVQQIKFIDQRYRLVVIRRKLAVLFTVFHEGRDRHVEDQAVNDSLDQVASYISIRCQQWEFVVNDSI